MERPLKRHSLSTKILISVIVWVVCALIFTGYTLALLWKLEEGGIAINDAGSLRMRTYHIATLLPQQEASTLSKEEKAFVSILDNLKKNNRDYLLIPDSTDINTRIADIQQKWQEDILPMIQNYDTADSAMPTKALGQLDQFVISIDHLVDSIEKENTKHIGWLRIFQSILIIMVIISAFTTIYLLYRLVINPLRLLQAGITQISQGNLSNRIKITSHDEFGTVSVGFNKMAANLEDLYNNLGEKVAEKTATLEEKNQELSALYNVTAFLHRSHTREDMVKTFLDEIIKISSADAGSVRLFDQENKRLNFIASQGLSEDLLNASRCSSITECLCGITATQDDIQIFHLPKSDPETVYCIKNYFEHFIIFHIQHNNNKIGIMTLYFKTKNYQLSSQMNYLIESLTSQLAIALENQQLALSDKRLAVMKERNLIAQGLHDSIAQSLSFMNIQAQMLQTALANNELKQVEKNLDFIQKGIQESYEDVRELLLNFRTNIDQENFKKVVEKLVERFKLQTGIDVRITYSGKGPSLNPQQQLQVTFILQEALSNVRKHAEAQGATVAFQNDDQFIMTISDDGHGFDSSAIGDKKVRHVGMSIMAERAAQISSDLKIDAAINQGTTVTLTIPKEERGIL